MVILNAGETPSVSDFHWQRQFPIIDDLSTEFALLAAKIDVQVLELSINRLTGLKTCIEMKLKSKDRAGRQCLPSTAKELISAIHQYWDFLNFEFAQLVVQYLGDDSLQREIKIYEENVRLKVKATLDTCRNRGVQPEYPPNFVPMSVTIGVDPHSYSLHNILQMKDFLIHKIGLNIALFAGWTKGSLILHFYIMEEDLVTAERELKARFQDLQMFQVTRLEVFGRFHVAVPIHESEVSYSII